MNCIICTKELIGQQKKFCSRKCHNQYGNYKHQNYIKQKERSLKRKKELINLSGGCCTSCGYSKNYAALEFHHINPAEKDHNLDARKLSNSTWEWCLRELKRCTLLCSNCHAEQHYPHLQIIKEH